MHNASKALIMLVSHIWRSRQPSHILALILLFIILPTNQTLRINSSLPTFLDKSLGINCRGSILCPSHLEAFPPDYIGTFIRITTGRAQYCPPDFNCGPLNDTDFYLPNDFIVCIPQGKSFLGGICAFTQGSNVPGTGVTGDLIKRRLRDLGDHGCRVCGSVPLSGDNDPGREGILTVNYVSRLACKGLCPPRQYTHYTALLQSTANGS